MIITAFIDLYPVQLAPPAKLSNDHLRTAGAYSSHGERDGSKGEDFWPTRKPLISTPALSPSNQSTNVSALCPPGHDVLRAGGEVVLPRRAVRWTLCNQTHREECFRL